MCVYSTFLSLLLLAEASRIPYPTRPPWWDTLGIVANVSLSLAITFVLFITMLLIGIFCYTIFTGKDKVTNYLSGTGEKFTLNLRLKKEISNQYENIVHFSMDENKNFLYIFQSPNKEYLSLIIEELDKNDLISFSID